jgi:hypothetical protein
MELINGSNKYLIVLALFCLTSKTNILSRFFIITSFKLQKYFKCRIIQNYFCFLIAIHAHKDNQKIPSFKILLLNLLALDSLKKFAPLLL